MGKQRSLLEHHAHPPLRECIVRARAADQFLSDVHGSGIVGIEPRDQAQRGGLPAAAGPQEAENLT